MKVDERGVEIEASQRVYDLMNPETLQATLFRMEYEARVLWRMKEILEESYADSQRRKRIVKMIQKVASVGSAIVLALVLMSAMPVAASGDAVATSAPALVAGWDARDLIIVGLIVVIVVQAIATRKLIPPELVMALVGTLRDRAGKTPDTRDDEMMKVIEDTLRKMFGAAGLDEGKTADGPDKPRL